MMTGPLPLPISTRNRHHNHFHRRFQFSRSKAAHFYFTTSLHVIDEECLSDENQGLSASLSLTPTKPKSAEKSKPKTMNRPHTAAGHPPIGRSLSTTSTPTLSAATVRRPSQPSPLAGSAFASTYAMFSGGASITPAVGRAGKPIAVGVGESKQKPHLHPQPHPNPRYPYSKPHLHQTSSSPDLSTLYSSRLTAASPSPEPVRVPPSSFDEQFVVGSKVSAVVQGQGQENGNDNKSKSKSNHSHSDFSLSSFLVPTPPMQMPTAPSPLLSRSSSRSSARSVSPAPGQGNGHKNSHGIGNGTANWMTVNTYAETPKFTRLGLGSGSPGGGGSEGVVMPISAKQHAKEKGKGKGKGKERKEELRRSKTMTSLNTLGVGNIASGSGSVPTSVYGHGRSQSTRAYTSGLNYASNPNFTATATAIATTNPYASPTSSPAIPVSSSLRPPLMEVRAYSEPVVPVLPGVGLGQKHIHTHTPSVSSVSSFSSINSKSSMSSKFLKKGKNQTQNADYDPNHPSLTSSRSGSISSVVKNVKGMLQRRKSLASVGSSGGWHSRASSVASSSSSVGSGSGLDVGAIPPVPVPVPLPVSAPVPVPEQKPQHPHLHSHPYHSQHHKTLSTISYESSRSVPAILPRLSVSEEVDGELVDKDKDIDGDEYDDEYEEDEGLRDAQMLLDVVLAFHQSGTRSECSVRSKKRSTVTNSTVPTLRPATAPVPVFMRVDVDVANAIANEELSANGVQRTTSSSSNSATTPTTPTPALNHQNTRLLGIGSGNGLGNGFGEMGGNRLSVMSSVSTVPSMYSVESMASPMREGWGWHSVGTGIGVEDGHDRGGFSPTRTIGSASVSSGSGSSAFLLMPITPISHTQLHLPVTVSTPKGVSPSLGLGSGPGQIPEQEYVPGSGVPSPLSRLSPPSSLPRPATAKARLQSVKSEFSVPLPAPGVLASRPGSARGRLYQSQGQTQNDHSDWSSSSPASAPEFPAPIPVPFPALGVLASRPGRSNRSPSPNHGKSDKPELELGVSGLGPMTIPRLGLVEPEPQPSDAENFDQPEGAGANANDDKRREKAMKFFGMEDIDAFEKAMSMGMGNKDFLDADPYSNSGQRLGLGVDPTATVKKRKSSGASMRKFFKNLAGGG
ncbi:hypothetical protein D9758_011965 [Tetrapyrgos nigripes]|uniref:Uncharacterized protein n=1 Tax=Tetrapyrgos nigripes TaxID=182062 RepID=A0A8H5D425_9AGAR|nr:hypothetical protein D9758_011965 [Tetrapyrgos nigripes]